MKTEKKIAVALAAALAIAIFAGGAVSMVGADPATVTFTVDVRAFNVELDVVNTDFETITPGENKEMHAFDLTNPGEVAVHVDGKFLTGDGLVSFGFVSDGEPILLASNFQLNGESFNDDGSEAELMDVGQGTTQCHASLTVPALQNDVEYTGTIELIFSAADV